MSFNDGNGWMEMTKDTGSSSSSSSSRCTNLVTGVDPSMQRSVSREQLGPILHVCIIGSARTMHYLQSVFRLDPVMLGLGSTAGLVNLLKPNSSNYDTLPYRPNLPFLISDIRALWRSVALDIQSITT